MSAWLARKFAGRRLPYSAQRRWSGLLSEQAVASWTRKFKITLFAAGGIFLLWIFARGIRQFEVRPLDAPGTLHALLWPYFVADYLHAPLSLELWLIVSQIALAVCVVLALGNLFSPRLSNRWLRTAWGVLFSPAIFWLSAAASLFLCRFPTIVGGPANVDEAQWVTAANSLFADPVFFRAVDGTTSGPLNIYPLMLPSLFGLSPDYGSSRLVGLVLIWASLYVMYRAFLLIAAPRLALVAIVPALSFFCLVTEPDFISYNSETVSLLILSLTIWAALRIVQKPTAWQGPAALLGALVSAAFFAKVQAVPVVGCAALAGAGFAIVRSKSSGPWRPWLYLAAGAVPLTAFVLIVNAAFGLTRDFWNSYILGTGAYARSSQSSLLDLPKLAHFILGVREFQFTMLIVTALIAVSVFREIVSRKQGAAASDSGAWAKIGNWIVMAAVAAVAIALGIGWFLRAGAPGRMSMAVTAFLLNAAGVLWLMWRDRQRGRKTPVPGWLLIAMMAGCVVSLNTQNYFPHYLFLLVLPLMALWGWIMTRHAENAVAFAGLLLVMTATANLESQEYLKANWYNSQKQSGSVEGKYIDQITPAGSSIVVWGWRPEIYLSAGRTLGTRDVNMHRFFEFGEKLNEYYRARFLEDISRRKPALFVDAIDVSCCYLNKRAKEDPDLFPPIRDYLRANYQFVGEKYSERYYLRRDLVRPAVGKN